jgi:glutaconyl-CoA/methylmalonyl-CoA decarboxylase subunit delta
MINLILPDFSQIDGFSATIALVGYLVVFIALVLLYFVFYNLPSLLKIDIKSYISGKREDKTGPKQDHVKMTGEVNAAIGLAIFLHFNEMHDKESGVITIRRISKRYSPWSSKIYGLRQNPRY